MLMVITVSRHEWKEREMVMTGLVMRGDDGDKK